MTAIVNFRCNCCGHIQVGVDKPREILQLGVAVSRVYGTGGSSNTFSTYNQRVLHICKPCAIDKLMFVETAMAPGEDAIVKNLKDWISNEVHDQLQEHDRHST